MKIAFVGVKRKYQELAPDYRDAFNQYHLELPFYYARDGKNDVTITTVDYEQSGSTVFLGGGSLTCVKERQLQDIDVVVHWRKWFPDLYVPGALNLVNCQDHSFSPEWKQDVRQAMNSGQLFGILCFPTWHKRNLQQETGIPTERLLDGVTLGVDTDIYKPALVKDPYQMLWASDPGRGLMGAVQLAIQIWQREKKFKMHVCYPDYVKGDQFNLSHPAIQIHRNLQNGPKLWELFNSSGVLPYTSSFMEPSSRAHRQAQAAGSMVLYPPDRGTPSELIQSDVTGVVAPIPDWCDVILKNIETGKWKEIGQNARAMAVQENWAVQADRFNKLVSRIRETGNA